MSKPAINRRTFIKAGAVTGGGLLIAFMIPEWIGKNTTKKSPVLFSPNTFLQIGSDNSINVIIGKVEMGQGIWTTLPTLIAEELDCDPSAIQVMHRGPGKGEDFNAPLFEQSTGGSSSTYSMFDRYREAGATARMMLINAAAKKFGVSAGQCRTENGCIVCGDTKLTYGEVAADALNQPVPKVTLRDKTEWKYIGKPQQRLDATAKVNGEAVYGIDIQFPELLVAVVAHAPVFGGTIKSFDASKTKAVEGVVEVTKITTGITVLAKNYWAAKLGRDALTIEWDHGNNKNINTDHLIAEYKELAKSKGKIVQQKGDAVTGLHTATLEREYIFPYLAHAPMEPLNCTVQIEKDKCEIWVGTQWPLLRQKEIAAYLNMQPEQINIHTPFLGGSFGRRGTFGPDWVMEAVEIAKVTGKLIKLIWSREDDIKGGYYRPVYMHKIKIGINEAGIPVAWQHRVVGQSLFVNTALEQAIAPNGIDYSSVDGVNNSPYIAGITDLSLELKTTTNGVPVSAWRSVGNTHTAYVMETLVDELAAHAGKDPVDYRRQLLKNHPRHLAALNLATEKAGWTSAPPPGVYRGVAVHEAMKSMVCQVVEITINGTSIKVHKVICAIDCGLPVDPDGVRAQMESGIVYGLSAALYGDITIKNGEVQQSNFHDYAVTRMDNMPQIEVHLVESNANMGGAGEPGVPPIAPAIANAVYAATGKRIMRLPIRLG